MKSLPQQIIDKLWYQAKYSMERYDFYVQEVKLDDNFDKVCGNSRYNIYCFQGSED
jgi:hypothetical protein